jgi:hypothetical protein
MRGKPLWAASRVLGCFYRTKCQFSTAGSSLAICDDAKAKLRLLYRKIHPDLFHGDEKARETNEKSFKLLQDFIHNASSIESHQHGRSNHSVYDFKFYVVEDHDGLPQIDVKLPAPRSTSPMVTRRNLNRLLKAANIEELECGTTYGSTHSCMPESLKEFISLVHEEYVLDSLDVKTPEMELRTLQTALHFSRKLRVVFTKKLPLPLQSTTGKIHILQQFVRSVEMCPIELSNGVTIVFGDSFTVDAREGTVSVQGNADPKEWVSFLNAIELNELREGLEMKEAIRTLEGQVAEKLGVGSIKLSADACTFSQAYESFLLLILRSTLPKSLMLPGLSLYFDPKEAAPEKDIEHGILYVNDCLKSLQMALENTGPRAEQYFNLLREKKAQKKALVTHVERRLRLRLLSQDPELEDFRFKAACQKLLSNAADLIPLLEGLKLRIAHQNAYVKGRGCIDIAWDFRV